MSDYIAVPKKVYTEHHSLLFSELLALAADKTHGICDAVKRDREIWDAIANKDPKESYNGLHGWQGRQRMEGYAIFRLGDKRDFQRDDVAALYMQCW